MQEMNALQIWIFEALSKGEFWAGVLASIIATLLIYLVSKILVATSNVFKDGLYLVTVSRRFRREGLRRVYLSRQDYVKYRKESSVSDYILTAKQSLTYGGLWLSHSTEMSKIDDAIRTLLNKNVFVEFILLDYEVDDEYIQILERFFSMSPGTMRQRLYGAWNHWREFNNGLEERLQRRFSLIKHRELMTYSFFLFDGADESSRFLVDFKLFALGRDDSFGIEVVRKRSGSGLYERFHRSYEHLAAGAITTD